MVQPEEVVAPDIRPDMPASAPVVAAAAEWALLFLPHLLHQSYCRWISLLRVVIQGPQAFAPAPAPADADTVAVVPVEVQAVDMLRRQPVLQRRMIVGRQQTIAEVAPDGTVAAAAAAGSAVVAAAVERCKLLLNERSY